MRTSELGASKIYYNDIQTLLNEGIIEKLKQGYYYLIDEYNSNEIDIIKRLYPDAILCIHTALFHYGYSDRTPSEWNLAVDDVKNMIEEIINTPTGNDFIEMSARGFEEISPQRKYKDISTQIIGRIKNVRVPFNVDISVGDVVVINQIKTFLEPVYDAMVNETEWQKN